MSPEIIKKIYIIKHRELVIYLSITMKAIQNPFKRRQPQSNPKVMQKPSFSVHESTRFETAQKYESTQHLG